MSACQFVRLQQVVCIGGDWNSYAPETGDDPGYDGPHPREGEMCVIESIVPGPGGDHLILEGYKPWLKYSADRFRKLGKREQELSDSFQQMLDGLKATETVRA